MVPLDCIYGMRVCQQQLSFCMLCRLTVCTIESPSLNAASIYPMSAAVTTYTCFCWLVPWLVPCTLSLLALLAHPTAMCPAFKQEPPNFGDMPEECWLAVLSQLNTRDVCATTCLNKCVPHLCYCAAPHCLDSGCAVCVPSQA